MNDSSKSSNDISQEELIIDEIKFLETINIVTVPQKHINDMIAKVRLIKRIS